MPKIKFYFLKEMVSMRPSVVKVEDGFYIFYFWKFALWIDLGVK